MNELMFNIGAVAARENAAYLEQHLGPGLSVNTTISCNCNSSGNYIGRAVGETQGQYGSTRVAPGCTKLAFASPEFVDFRVRGSLMMWICLVLRNGVESHSHVQRLGSTVLCPKATVVPSKSTHCIACV